MRELKNLEAIWELLASHPIYTYDYSDGLLVNQEDTNIQIYSIDLEDEPFVAYISGYIITYASEEVLFENLRENIISHMDLTKGTDDQYYDYSPAQVEAILFGILQLTPEHQDYIITGLKKHLREFIQDDEQDKDMISQYTIIYNAIEKWESDHRETEIFQQLAVSGLFNQLYKVNLHKLLNVLEQGMSLFQLNKWKTEGIWYPITQYKKESDKIQVVTNLFIPEEQKEYHIQLSGNYPEESDDWNNFLEENQWKIYPLLANIIQVFLPTGNYQLFYTQYPQGFISIIAKPHDK